MGNVEKKEREKDTISDATSLYVASKLPEETPYGLTPKYERKLYDSEPAKKAFRKDLLDGRKTTVKDGAILHEKQVAAQNKYGAEKAPYHQLQVDHKDPIRNAHERNKKKLFISDEDFKKIMNRKRNFQALSKHDNASKRDRSEMQMALDRNAEGSVRYRISRFCNGVVAETETQVLIRAKQAENIGKEFLKGAGNALTASAIPLVIRGAQDLVKVANREMTAEEAVEDLGSLGVSIVARGGTLQVASHALGQVLKDKEVPILESFAKINEIGNVLVVGSIIARATGKYLSGEVDGAGFFEEISQDGISLISGMLAAEATTSLLSGVTAGGVVGLAVSAAPVLAAMIVSAACSAIYAEAQRLRKEKKDNREIRKIAAQACRCIQAQKSELRELLSQDHEQWAQQMTDIFKKIASGITNDSIAETNRGLGELLMAYKKEVSFYETSIHVAEDLMRMRNGIKQGLI